MDFRTSRKETRLQPDGVVDVLVSNVTDLYPIFEDEAESIISDVEILDDARLELLDRAMFAVVKQRGNDPLNLEDGNQIEECLMGEISPVALIGQISSSVAQEGPGVRISFDTGVVDGKEYLTVALTLVPAI
jgi:hypothetical protein